MTETETKAYARIAKWNRDGIAPKPTPQDSSLWHRMAKKGLLYTAGGFFWCVNQA